jgi:hypothetical protein
MVNLFHLFAYFEQEEEILLLPNIKFNIFNAANVKEDGYYKSYYLNYL